MATRGRKPKPTELKALTGNPGKRRLPADEPKPEPTSAVPEPPDYLGETAAKQWRRIAPQLHALGLLTGLDETALAAYCDAFGRWVEAGAEVRKKGALVKVRGYPMQNPYLVISNKALKQMKEMLTEFGMSPSSRARVKVSRDETDELEQFLGQKNGK